jgi:hypothetical protein
VKRVRNKRPTKLVVHLWSSSLDAGSIPAISTYHKDYNKRLIPVLVGPRESIPEEKIPWILRRLEAIELPNPEEQEEGVRQIKETLLKAS